MEQPGRVTWTVEPRGSGERVGDERVQISNFFLAFRPIISRLRWVRSSLGRDAPRRRPIIWDDRDIVPPSGLFTYGVGLTAGTSFFCEPGATLEVTGATASAAALSFGRGPASIFAALIV